MLLHHGLQSPKNARVLYVDMNGFFASIEQQDHPELRGKPVAVVSHLHPRATVLASSYEAKALGITTGTRIQDARSICPTIRLFEGRPSRYKAVQKQIVQILIDVCGPEVQPRSIDEAAVFLARNWQTSEITHELAHTIKQRFRNELGPAIRASIGIAPNSLLAKLATDLRKPDGLLEITLENTPTILKSLPLVALPGIAERMAKRLENIGLMEPMDIYTASPTFLRNHFGIWGQYWWWRLHGYECDDHQNDTLKSMSHEHVLSTWVSHKSEVEATILKMADRLLHRLYRNDLQCRSLYLILKLAGAPRYYQDRRLDVPTADTLTLLEGFREMTRQLPSTFPYPVRKVVLGFGGMVPSTHGVQINLFNPTSPTLNINKLVGKIRDEYGYDALQLGSSLSLQRHVAQEQVGFGRIRDN